MYVEINVILVPIRSIIHAYTLAVFLTQHSSFHGYNKLLVLKSKLRCRPKNITFSSVLLLVVATEPLGETRRCTQDVS